MHFRASLPLLANPSLDPDCDGGRFMEWMMRQGTVEASTRMGSDASLL